MRQLVDSLSCFLIASRRDGAERIEFTKCLIASGGSGTITPRQSVSTGFGVGRASFKSCFDAFRK
jgi:hypothetical protein